MRSQPHQQQRVQQNNWSRRMTHHFSRRTMLRGLGVSMALPWMESLAVWGDDSAPKPEPASQAPVRVAVLFSGMR